MHVDLPSKSNVTRFLGILAANGLHQHICGPTHKAGHTLDLIISRLEDNLVTGWKLLPSLGSDHLLIDCTIDSQKPPPMRITCTVRNIKNINKVSFTNDILSTISDLDLCEGTVDEIIERFDISLVSVLNSHAPPQQRSRIVRSRSPWFNEEVDDARRERRRMERKWLKSKEDVDHDAYVKQTAVTAKLIQCAKEVYFREQLNNSDSKTMFSTLNRLLNPNIQQIPNCNSAIELSNSLARFS